MRLRQARQGLLITVHQGGGGWGGRGLFLYSASRHTGQKTRQGPFAPYHGFFHGACLTDSNGALSLH